MFADIDLFIQLWLPMEHITAFPPSYWDMWICVLRQGALRDLGATPSQTFGIMCLVQGLRAFALDLPGVDASLFSSVVTELIYMTSPPGMTFSIDHGLSNLIVRLYLSLPRVSHPSLLISP